MKTIIIIAILIAIVAATVWFLLLPGNKSEVKSKGNPADAGKSLRLMALTTPAEKCGFTSDQDYPKVYGVVTDWNLGAQTASILSMRDGAASLYTTSTFGIIGGEGHSKVRKAAELCVHVAGQYYGKSIPVTDFPYPKKGTVNFYLLCYEGVRLCVGEETGINGGTDPTRPLFAAAQDVLTELRLVSEEKMK